MTSRLSTVDHRSNWPGKNRLKISVTPKNPGDVTMIAVHYSATRSGKRKSVKLPRCVPIMSKN